jgi:hypothetical protein
MGLVYRDVVVKSQYCLTSLQLDTAKGPNKQLPPASSEKAGFAKLVDASAMVGAKLTLAMRKKWLCRHRPTLRLLCSI